MAVSPSIVECASKAWTLIASGAEASVGFQFVEYAKAYLLPTDSNTEPAALAGETSAWLVEAGIPVNVASDISTYWWIWNDSEAVFNLKVWKL